MNEPGGRQITRLNFEEKLDLMTWLRKHDERLGQTSNTFMAVANQASDDLKFHVSSSAVQSVVNALRKKGEPLKYTGYYKERTRPSEQPKEDQFASRAKVWRLEQRVIALETKLKTLYTTLGEKYENQEGGS